MSMTGVEVYLGQSLQISVWYARRRNIYYCSEEWGHPNKWPNSDASYRLMSFIGPTVYWTCLNSTFYFAEGCRNTQRFSNPARYRASPLEADWFSNCFMMSHFVFQTIFFALHSCKLYFFIVYSFVNLWFEQWIVDGNKVYHFPP